jgi:hypothetical protein
MMTLLPLTLFAIYIMVPQVIELSNLILIHI